MKTITIKTFENDTEADNFFEQFNPPRYYDGKKVIGCELEYACKANNFKKTRLVIKTAQGETRQQRWERCHK